MTNNGSSSRLDRIEALVESNARAIEALSTQLTEQARNAAEERAELRQATIGIANLLSSLDSDRPTILRKLNVIENKIDRLLEGDKEQPEQQQI